MRVENPGILKWLYPGIGIKRWIGLSTFGVLLLILGTANLRSEEFWAIQLLDAVVVVSGIIILILGIKRMMRSFIAVFVPSSKDAGLVDLLYQKKAFKPRPADCDSRWRNGFVGITQRFKSLFFKHFGSGYRGRRWRFFR